MVIIAYRCVSPTSTLRLLSHSLENEDTIEHLKVSCRPAMVTTAASIPFLPILYVKNVALMIQFFMMMTLVSTGGALWNSLPSLVRQASF